MMKHTPGPWKWWTSNSWRRLRADEGRGVTRSVLEPYTCRDGHADCIVTDADMALIAAAPQLLETLKAIVALTDRDHVAWDNARAAIAKATGGE